MDRKPRRKPIPKFTDWSDDELIDHRKNLDKTISGQEAQIEEISARLESLKSIKYNTDEIMSALQTELERRGISDFESQMRRKYGEGFSDKRWGKVFRLAWDRGHSSGESDVENHLIDLVDLFNDEEE